jgi:hypothetical protein
LKNLILCASVAAILGGTAAIGQEKSAFATIVPVSFPAQQRPYSPDEIKVLGTLENGQTSKPVAYTKTVKYQSFVFEGYGRDQVEVTVAGPAAKAYVALADSTLTPIASGLGRVSVALPYHGPDLEAFYILVKSLSSQPSQLTVHLRKIAGPTPHSPDATR